MTLEGMRRQPHRCRLQKALSFPFELEMKRSTAVKTTRYFEHMRKRPDRATIREEWIEFVRTPAPATETRGKEYGGQWWLVPEGRDDVPRDAYATAGNRGQFVIVVPSHDVVIVRRGLDWGRQGFDRWDLTREVLKAFAPTSAGE